MHLAETLYEAFMKSSKMPGRAVPRAELPSVLRAAWDTVAREAIFAALDMPTEFEREAPMWTQCTPAHRLYNAFRSQQPWRQRVRPWRELGDDEKLRWEATWDAAETWVANLAASTILERLRRTHRACQPVTAAALVDAVKSENGNGEK